MRDLASPVSCKDWLWPLTISLHPPCRMGCAGAGSGALMWSVAVQRVHRFWVSQVVQAKVCIIAPPTSLDGCDFFNSVVVRLPFNSISDSSKWWLLHILVVNLMQLCEESSHAYLCHHLDWKSFFFFNHRTNGHLKKFSPSLWWSPTLITVMKMFFWQCFTNGRPERLEGEESQTWG